MDLGSFGGTFGDPGVPVGGRFETLGGTFLAVTTQVSHTSLFWVVFWRPPGTDICIFLDRGLEN